MVGAGAGLGAGIRPFGLSATEHDLAKIDALARLSVSRAETLFGFTAEGWKVETPERVGLLLHLGLPDGRWPGRERAEAAVCMTSSQARGVQSMGTGALVFGIGHNPCSASKVDRFARPGLSTRPAESLPWVLRGNWSDLARGLRRSRFASFERLLASYVVFHTAVATTRDLMNRLVPLANLLWAPVFYSTELLTGGRVRFGYWELARTLSGTRIATTAAPVPATNMAPEDYLTPAERYATEAAPRALCVDSSLPVPEPLAGQVRLAVAARASGARARTA